MLDQHGDHDPHRQPGATPSAASPGKRTATQSLPPRGHAGARPTTAAVSDPADGERGAAPADDPYGMHLTPGVAPAAIGAAVAGEGAAAETGGEVVTADRADRLHLVDIALDRWSDRRKLGVDEFVTLAGMEKEDTDSGALPGFLRELLLAIVSKGTGLLLDKLTGALIARLRGGLKLQPAGGAPDSSPVRDPDRNDLIAAVTIVNTKAKAKADVFAAAAMAVDSPTPATRNDRKLLITSFSTAVKDGIGEVIAAQKIALTTFRGTRTLSDELLIAYEHEVGALAATAINDEIDRCVTQWARSVAHGAHGTEQRDGQKVTKLDDVVPHWGAGQRDTGVLNVAVDFKWGGGLEWRDVGTEGLDPHLLASLIHAADGRLGDVAMPRMIHASFRDPRYRLAAINLVVDERGAVHRLTPILRTTGTLWRPGPVPPEAGFADHPEALWHFLQTVTIPSSFWPARLLSPTQRAGARR